MRVLCLASLSILLAGTCVAAAQQEAAVTALARQFYATYAERNLDGFLALWSERSPDWESRRAEAQRVFAAYDRITLDLFWIRIIEMRPESARVRISRELRADSNTSAPGADLGKSIRTLECILEDQRWKVWREASAVDDLADALIATKSDSELRALIAKEKELVTVELRRALLEKAERLYAKGNYPHLLAIFLQAKGLAEQIQDEAGIALALRDIGILYRRQGDYTKAVEYYQESLKVAGPLGNGKINASLLHNLGFAHRVLGNYAQALEYLLQSVPLFEELGDQEGLSSAFNIIGTVHYLQGNLTQAVEFYEKSLRISEQLGNRGAMSDTWSNLGVFYREQGEYARALEYYGKGLSYYEEAGDKDGLGRTLNNMGVVYEWQGNYAKALEYYQKSLRIREAIGNKAGIANVSINIGNLHRLQGNYVQAQRFYRTSLRLSEELPDKAGIALALECLGTVQSFLGRYQSAQNYFQKSLAIARDLGDKAGMATVLQDMGEIQARQGSYARALEPYRQSLALADELGDKGTASRVLHHMAEARQAQGRPHEALQYAERAALIARQVGYPDALWRARTDSARAFRSLGRRDQARQALDDAIATIETLRTHVAGAETEQQRFFEDKLAPYHEMIDLLAAEGRGAAALAYAERAKARALLDVLQRGRIQLTKAMTMQEQTRERELNAALASLNWQIERERSRAKPDRARLSVLSDRLDKARSEHDAFRISLYSAHPELKVQRGEMEPMTLPGAARLLRDSRTVLLEFAVTNERTYAFVVTGSSPELRPHLQTLTFNIGNRNLAARIALFRAQLANRDLGFRDSAQQLYNVLLKPAEAELRGKTSLIIVPDRTLWELPFQALLTPSDHYLLEDFAVSYAPSLAVLREMRRFKERRQPRGRRGSLLALGNPATEVARGDRLASPLPMAEQEVKELARLYGPESRVYVRAEASEDRFKAEAAGFAVLHLATHGILDNTSPLFSLLVLAPPKRTGTEDGLLEAWELMQMDLKADLAVLSACETARGHVSAGEGVIGLSWALFVAGVPTAVVSQWKVDSASTSQLMVNFHRHVQAGLTKAEALRRAAGQMLRDPAYRHPFYWAPFVVVGAGS